MIKMAQQLPPTITFIMPIQKKENFLVEQITTIFTISEWYSGLCEIMILGNGAEDNAVKIAWLAMKLSKIKHPHVRTKMINFTSQLEINDVVETGIKHALGQKIIVVTGNPEKIESEKISGASNEDILTVKSVLDEGILEKIEPNTSQK
jgi:hypothetical protein